MQYVWRACGGQFTEVNGHTVRHISTFDDLTCSKRANYAGGGVRQTRTSLRNSPRRSHQACVVSPSRIPPLNGGIHLSSLSDFPGPPQCESRLRRKCAKVCNDCVRTKCTKKRSSFRLTSCFHWLRGQDLNLRPSGYETEASQTGIIAAGRLPICGSSACRRATAPRAPPAGGLLHWTSPAKEACLTRSGEERAMDGKDEELLNQLFAAMTAMLKDAVEIAAAGQPARLE